MITRFLINRRDKAAHTWVTELQHDKETQGTRRRLKLWDTLLDHWTCNGTRRT